MDDYYSRLVLYVLICPHFNYEPMAISLILCQNPSA